jgi:hypothetical protein
MKSVILIDNSSNRNRERAIELQREYQWAILCVPEENFNDQLDATNALAQTLVRFESLRDTPITLLVIDIYFNNTTQPYEGLDLIYPQLAHYEQGLRAKGKLEKKDTLWKHVAFFSAHAARPRNDPNRLAVEEKYNAARKLDPRIHDHLFVTTSDIDLRRFTDWANTLD